MTPERAEEMAAEARRSTPIFGSLVTLDKAIAQAIIQACAEEREACARICERFAIGPMERTQALTATECAAAIRGAE